ncbi:MAG: hypothetical protein ACI9HA_002402, partial [Dinoroseobacter sp.]
AEPGPKRLPVVHVMIANGIRLTTYSNSMA